MHRPLLKPARYPMHYNIFCDGAAVAMLFDGALLLRNLPTGEPVLPTALLCHGPGQEWERMIRTDTRFFVKWQPLPYVQRRSFHLADWRRVSAETDGGTLQKGIREIADAWIKAEKMEETREKEQTGAMQKGK